MQSFVNCNKDYDRYFKIITEFTINKFLFNGRIIKSNDSNDSCSPV